MEELFHKIGDRVTTIDTILGKGHSTPTTVVDHGTIKDIELCDNNIVKVTIEYTDRWEIECFFGIDEFNQRTIVTAFDCFGEKNVNAIFFE